MIERLRGTRFGRRAFLFEADVEHARSHRRRRHPHSYRCLCQ